MIMDETEEYFLGWSPSSEKIAKSYQVAAARRYLDSIANYSSFTKSDVATPRTKSSSRVVKRLRFESDDDDDDHSNRNKIGRQMVLDHGPNPPPSLPIEFQDRIRDMGGSPETIVLVIQKALYWTDVNDAQNRLSIPQSQIRTEFLEDDERETLKGRNGDNNVAAMEVRLIDPLLQVCTVSLRRWEMKKKRGGSSPLYVLNGPSWKTMKSSNGLELGLVIQLWSFRVGGEPCFALVKLPGGEEDGGNVGAGSSPSNSNGAGSCNDGSSPTNSNGGGPGDSDGDQSSLSNSNSGGSNSDRNSRTNIRWW
ncbi:unnamed protein product [Ilex paraguariensis]|uniref:B3 domain-containing protein n=1 Tax=Ilex paraguariensis TaxID=185542 RepID=A0ABC8UPY0_9AQUA